MDAHKQKLIDFLEDGKWYPMIHVTNIEFETSKLLNAILADIQSKVIRGDLDEETAAEKDKDLCVDCKVMRIRKKTGLPEDPSLKHKKSWLTRLLS